MTHMLSGLAGGRLVVALEVCAKNPRAFLIFTFSQGGYNLDSISSSALAVTKVILGEAPDQLPPMTASETASETVWLVAKQHSTWWKSLDPKACEPREGNLFFCLRPSNLNNVIQDWKTSPSPFQRFLKHIGNTICIPNTI